MSRIFLSHAAEDSQIASELAARFHDTGLESWVDELDMETGRDLSRGIKEALREARAIVVLVSERSANSPWVQFEIGAAIGMGKQLIPVLVGERGIEYALPSSLQDLAYLDARGRSVDEIASDLIHILSKDKRVEVLRFEILDQAGVLAKIIAPFAEAQCHILEVTAHAGSANNFVEMVIEAPTSETVEKVLEELERLPAVLRITRTAEMRRFPV